MDGKEKVIVKIVTDTSELDDICAKAERLKSCLPFTEGRIRCIIKHLTSLLGEDSRNSTGISDWAKSTMDNWGQKAAEKLAESGAGEAAEKAAQTAAGIGGSPIGRTARSIVCAAVINAGIDMAVLLQRAEFGVS